MSIDACGGVAITVPILNCFEFGRCVHSNLRSTVYCRDPRSVGPIQQVRCKRILNHSIKTKRCFWQHLQQFPGHNLLYCTRENDLRIHHTKAHNPLIKPEAFSGETHSPIKYYAPEKSSYCSVQQDIMLEFELYQSYYPRCHAAAPEAKNNLPRAKAGTYVSTSWSRLLLEHQFQI